MTEACERAKSRTQTILNLTSIGYSEKDLNKYDMGHDGKVNSYDITLSVSIENEICKTN